MPKFHIAKAGGAAACNATVKACPLGDSPHGEFGSQGEANQWAEATLAEEYGGSFATPTVAEVDHAEALAKWEEQNEQMYVFSEIRENDFRQWDVDYLKSAISFSEDSAQAREAILDFREKLVDPYDENPGPEAVAIREQLRAILNEYDSTPRRQAEIVEERAAQAREAEQYRLEREAADREESARREALGPAGRWEEDYGYHLDPHEGIYLYDEVPEALDAAIEVAEESEEARAFIERARQAADWLSEDDVDFDPDLTGTVRASLARYDATPRRQAEIGAATAARQAYETNVSNLSSANPSAVRESFRELAKTPGGVRSYVTNVSQNPAAPADVLRAVTPHLSNDEDFIAVYNHPSQPFAAASVGDVSREPGFQRYDFYAKKIDGDRFDREDLDRLRSESSELGGEEKPVTPVLRQSLLSRLRARLNGAA